jgi:hypothetical protein
MSDVSTRAILEIVGVDKSAAALDSAHNKLNNLKKTAESVEGGKGGFHEIMTRRMQIFTGMVFLRAAQRAARAITEYIDTPLNNAIETSGKFAKSLYSQEAESRMRAIANALRDQKNAIQMMRFDQGEAARIEKSNLSVLEMEEKARAKTNGREREYLALQQQQRKIFIEHETAMKNETDLLEKQLAQNAAMSALIQEREHGGDESDRIRTRIDEAKKALAEFQATGGQLWGRPKWLESILSDAAGFTVGKNTEKMLNDVIDALEGLRTGERKNIETLNQEKVAMAQSIIQHQKRIETLKVEQTNIDRLYALELDAFARGEYESYLDKRKTAYEKLTDAIRNAKTESQAFLGGSMAWLRWMREPNAPEGTRAVYGGLQPNIMGPSKTQGEFSQQILTELRKSVTIWNSLEAFFKGQAQEPESAGSF